MPYSGYEKYQFNVPLGSNNVGVVGDCWNRYWLRIEEMIESCKIVKQAMDGLPAGKYAADLRKIKPAVGEAYTAIENPRGELGFYIVSDGSEIPTRCKVRAPSFVNLAIMSEVGKNNLIADLIAILGSIDTSSAKSTARTERPGAGEEDRTYFSASTASQAGPAPPSSRRDGTSAGTCRAASATQYVMPGRSTPLRAACAAGEPHEGDRPLRTSGFGRRRADPISVLAGSATKTPPVCVLREEFLPELGALGHGAADGVLLLSAASSGRTPLSGERGLVAAGGEASGSFEECLTSGWGRA
jgi:hypothetical protein